jgi:hypothetical protein
MERLNSGHESGNFGIMNTVIVVFLPRRVPSRRIRRTKLTFAQPMPEAAISAALRNTPMTTIALASLFVAGTVTLFLAGVLATIVED